MDIAKSQAKQNIDLPIGCPGLFNALQTQGLIAAIEPQLMETLSVGQLEFLTVNSEAARTGRLNQTGLDQLLASILTKDTANPENELWQAVLKWLDTLKTGDYESEYRWFVRFMEKVLPSEQTVRYFFYCSMALLAVISVWFLATECHRAGLFHKILRKSNSTSPALLGKESKNNTMNGGLTFSNPLPRQQIAALLEQVIYRLVEQKVVPGNPTLTYRQMIPIVFQRAGEASEIFTRLVIQAEPILYGNRLVNAQGLDQFYLDAQALFGKSPHER
ncbi:hypothetical protein [Methyloglobulus morosus]|uniref:hypothetical protein n=1 Tax=Methyloglobulus morosus TaxID=1410681 RepID=UPI00128EFCF1|nr:hypothetical protein [Methyloglobulus morosus]